MAATQPEPTRAAPSWPTCSRCSSRLPWPALLAIVAEQDAADVVVEVSCREVFCGASHQVPLTSWPQAARAEGGKGEDD